MAKIDAKYAPIYKHAFLKAMIAGEEIEFAPGVSVRKEKNGKGLLFVTSMESGSEIPIHMNELDKYMTLISGDLVDPISGQEFEISQEVYIPSMTPHGMSTLTGCEVWAILEAPKKSIA